jgi:hypothetical protein
LTQAYKALPADQATLKIEMQKFLEAIGLWNPEPYEPRPEIFSL